MSRFRLSALATLFLMLLLPAHATAAAGHAETPLLGLGDSIGEGVQSADATWRSQPSGYLPWIARQMAVPFSLPLIKGGLFTTVESTRGRTRLNDTPAQNLAVSGADVGSLLRDLADSVPDSETDLVLAPRFGSQLSIGTEAGPLFIVCWIGNNDSLGAALAFDQLDASQLTPLPQFEADYKEIIQRLHATGARIVVGNIPDVSQIGFLFSTKDLEYFLGSDFGLPEGSYTSLVAMLLLKMGIADATLLQNPDWVLDGGEVQTIRDRTAQFNQFIATAAAESEAAVVDVNGLFAAIRQNPPVVFGVRISNRFNGGVFSLDGVHPSNFTHALLADGFIRRANAQLGMTIPPLAPAQLVGAFLTDPFVDKDGDGRVVGRPGAGLLETLMPFLGFSGDQNDSLPNPTSRKIEPALAQEFIRAYRRVTAQPEDSPWDRDDVIEALRHALGLDRFRRH